MDNRNDHGQTPLHTTAERGSMEVVRLYIQIGADIMAQDKDGRTPLHLAAGNAHGPAVQALLEPDDGVRGLGMLQVLSTRSFSLPMSEKRQISRNRRKVARRHARLLTFSRIHKSLSIQ